MTPYIAAAVQMTSSADKEKNVETATRLVEDAADRGAKLVVLPELFNCLAEPDIIVSQAESVPGPTSDALSQVAARCAVTLVGGSIAEQAEDASHVYNSSVLIGPDGRQMALYRKVHLFDIDIPGRITFQESRFIEPGQQLVVSDTEVGRLGLATCYDLRFPELFRRLVDSGAALFALPAAFTVTTGRDHWEILLRSRAIENQVFVIAANQHGRHTSSISTYGRSMIIDPWGTVLATAPDGQGIALAEIDLERQKQIRASLPALQHRRALDQLPIS